MREKSLRVFCLFLEFHWFCRRESNDAARKNVQIFIERFSLSLCGLILSAGIVELTVWHLAQK